MIAFYLATEVKTFCFCGWCIAGVFCLLAFTCLGHHCLKVGVQGSQRAPGGVQLGVWGQSLLKLKAFFLNLRYENPHFLALHLVSNSHSQHSLVCFKAFFHRNKQGNAPGAGQRPKPSEAEGFLNLQYEKKIPGTLSCFTQPFTKFSFLCFNVIAIQ